MHGANVTKQANQHISECKCNTMIKKSPFRGRNSVSFVTLFIFTCDDNLAFHQPCVIISDLVCQMKKVNN